VNLNIIHLSINNLAAGQRYQHWIETLRYAQGDMNAMHKAQGKKRQGLDFPCGLNQQRLVSYHSEQSEESRLVFERTIPDD